MSNMDNTIKKKSTSQIRFGLIMLLLIIVAGGCVTGQKQRKSRILLKYQKKLKTNSNSQYNNMILGALYVKSEKYGRGLRYLKKGKKLSKPENFEGNYGKLLKTGLENTIKTVEMGLQKGALSVKGNWAADLIISGIQSMNNTILVTLEKITGDKLIEE